MNISSVDMSGVMKDVSVRASAPKTTMGSSQPAQTAGGNADVSPAQVKQIVAEMQSNLDSMNIGLQYSFYGEHDQKVAIKIVNKETGEVIREIPSKELQSLQGERGELVGKIFNGKA